MSERLKQFSPSRVSLYRRCPQKYEYQVIRQIKPLPSLNQTALDTGKLVHNVIAWYYTYKNNLPSMIEPRIYKALAECNYDIKRATDKEKEQLLNYFRHFEKFERLRLKQEWEVLYVEADSGLEWYHGIADLVIKVGRDKVVIDWKTGFLGARDLTEDQITQGAIYNYCHGAVKTIFYFLAAGTQLEVPNTAPLPNDIILKIINGEFPRNKNQWCKNCEHNIICYLEEYNTAIY